MKLIINESQLIKLIKERHIRLGGDETYSGRNYDEALVNKLLEKITASGWDSLTPKEKDTLMKMSKGDPIEVEDHPEIENVPQETPYDEENAGDNLLYQMFVINLPDTINIFGKQWNSYAMDIEGDVVPIVLTNGEKEIYIIPFPTPNTIEFGKRDPEDKLVMTIENPPKTQEEMGQFINQLINKVLPAVITKFK